MSERKEWEMDVYAPPSEEEVDGVEWKTLIRLIFKRDKKVCQRCGKKMRYNRGLSCHHIIPRSMGGQDDFSNLITLCHKCHDWVEWRCMKLNTRGKIKDSFDDPSIVISADVAEDIDSDDHPYYKSWYGRVYGGQK